MIRFDRIRIVSGNRWALSLSLSLSISLTLYPKHQAFLVFIEGCVRVFLLEKSCNKSNVWCLVGKKKQSIEFISIPMLMELIIFFFYRFFRMILGKRHSCSRSKNSSSERARDFESNKNWGYSCVTNQTYQMWNNRNYKTKISWKRTTIWKHRIIDPSWIDSNFFFKETNRRKKTILGQTSNVFFCLFILVAKIFFSKIWIFFLVFFRSHS